MSGSFPATSAPRQSFKAGSGRSCISPDKYADAENTKASKWMFDQPGVTYRKLEPLMQAFLVQNCNESPHRLPQSDVSKHLLFSDFKIGK
jgi:hypothetical protein